MNVRPLTDEEKARARFLPLRQALRQLELRLSLPVQRPILRLLGRGYDPYDETTDRTQSIFIHIPRAAGTSIAAALGRKDLHYGVTRYAAVDRERFDRYFKFTFARNPWDRLLSGYSRLGSSLISTEAAAWAHRNVATYRDFEEFVLALRDPAVRRRMMGFLHFRPQMSWLTFPGGRRIEMDFVGRFETLESDFQTVCEKLAVQVDLPATNASQHLPYRAMYTPQMRDIVAEAYREDIRVLSYEF